MFDRGRVDSKLKIALHDALFLQADQSFSFCRLTLAIYYIKNKNIKLAHMRRLRC